MYTRSLLNSLAVNRLYKGLAEDLCKYFRDSSSLLGAWRAHFIWHLGNTGDHQVSVLCHPTGQFCYVYLSAPTGSVSFPKVKGLFKSEVFRFLTPDEYLCITGITGRDKRLQWQSNGAWSREPTFTFVIFATCCLHFSAYL